MENIKDLGRFTIDFTQSGDMIFASSPDFKGLLVPGRSVKEVLTRLYDSLQELADAVAGKERHEEIVFERRGGKDSNE